MQIATLSLSQKGTPIQVREKFALNGPALRDAVLDLSETLAPVATESAVVCTCNRTELYVAGKNGREAADASFNWLRERFGVDQQDLKSHWTLSPDRSAVKHLFRVASGLDSMVLGEPQILGQIKGAARVAQDVGSLGSHLNKLFQNSFSVAKEVRSSTGVGEHSVSLGKAAVRTAQRVFENLSDCSVLFIGAGEMIELAGAHFRSTDPARMCVANRTFSRAKSTAEELGAETMAFESLAANIHQYDVIVTCTGSQEPIIAHKTLQDAIIARRRRPMVIVDLAVPRDVPDSVTQIQDIFLYSVDDLSEIVQAGHQSRQDALGQAESIIDSRTDAYMQWLADRQIVPVIRELQQRADQIRQHELERATRALERGDSPEQVLQAFSKSLSAKFMHGPMDMLRGTPQERHAIAQVIERLLPAVH